jgi:heme/copper-type cytochrome/quinol oxidase subunit 1
MRTLDISPAATFLALFRNPDYGYQHLFLFFGHPEVCILILQGIRIIFPIISYEKWDEKAFGN